MRFPSASAFLRRNVARGLRQTPAILRTLSGRVARWKGVLGLNYHRIGDGRRSVFDRGLWSATREDFDQQVRYAKANFDVIAPRDIADVVRAKRGRHVLITFDDGYADNYTDAFPVLRDNGVPGAFFVATGFVDEPRISWWDEIAWMVRVSRRSSVDLPQYRTSVVFDDPDREVAIRTLLRSYKQLPGCATAAYLDAVADALGSGRAPPDLTDARKLWMTWDMLREMHAGGMTIGGHTVSHPILSRLTRAEQSHEIETCSRRIREELGIPMEAFAYPVGSRDAFNDDTRACLRENGVSTAFSYYGGIGNLSAWDEYNIPRIAIEQDTTFDEFRALVMFPWTT